MAIYGTKGKDYLVGDDNDDQIFGDESDDVLVGKGGNDWLNGGPGGDHMYGGDGNDAYVVDSRDDLVVETRGGGYDYVHSSIDYTLPNNVEGLGLDEGSEAVYGAGNGLDNYINGNSNSNVLWGAGGDDHIDGEGGADLMYGGPGDDTFTVDDPYDTIFEYLDEGEDKVFASLDYELPDNVENLHLLDKGTALVGTGNELNNEIWGNIADNTLSGEDGDDVLIGGIGADTMIGGDGDDTYHVDDIGDQVIETSALGGVDQVRSSISYTLGAFEERLQLMDSGGAIGGIGNELDNEIAGNGYSNVLTGGDGNDHFRLFNDPSISENDTITDFHAGDAYGDVIEMWGYNLAGGFAELLPYLSQVGNDVVGNFDSFNTLTLQNVQLSDLNANDFLFLNPV
jgi:Ca2+-binding RTX toxin-like protein